MKQVTDHGTSHNYNTKYYEFQVQYNTMSLIFKSIYNRHNFWQNSNISKNLSEIYWLKVLLYINL